MKNKQTKVNYADLWGLREEKYKFLDGHDIENTKWQDLKPTDPQNFFVVKDFGEENRYKKFISVSNIFRKFNAGIATGKDDVLVGFDRQSLLRKLSVNDKSAFELFMENNKVNKELAGKWFDELNKISIGEQIKEYSYRPFDNRFVIYNTKILQRSRNAIMKNFIQQNFGLVTTKQLSTETFTHALVTNSVSDRCLISLKTKEVSYIFPLYLYNNEKERQKTIFDGQEKLDIESAQRTSNINWSNLPTFCSTLQSFTSSLTGSFIQPVEAIFYYIYAILYSNVYRRKYQEFLKIDFPRIPFTKDDSLFRALAQRGEQLANLHLLKSTDLNKPKTKFYRKGSNTVAMRKFIEADEVGPELDFPRLDWDEDKYKFKKRGIVVINESNQFFGPVNEDAWNYQIGGYQVLDKWLKDRKGRALSSEDIKHYCKVATAISKTIGIQKEIDKLYPKVERSLII